VTLGDPLNQPGGRRRLPEASRSVLLASVLAACGAARVADVVGAPARPTPPEPAATVAPVVAAHWAVRYAPGELSTSVIVDGDRRISVGPRGERWLTSRGGRTPAAVPLPEQVLAVVVRADEVEFVGASGTVYPAPLADPLTSAITPRSPPRPLAHVVTGKVAILGVAGADVVRTVDGGKTWTTRPTGAAPRVVDSIALCSRGVGAMLLSPQWSLVSDDDGATWSHIPAPPEGIGAVRVAGDRVVAEPPVLSAEGAELSAAPLRWTATRLPDDSSQSTPAPAEPRFEYGPLGGRGALAGRRWLELISDETPAKLWAEDLEEKAPPVVVRTMPECEQYGPASVGASPDGGAVVVACAAAGSKGDVDLFRSRNGGQDWTSDGHVFATEDELHVAVANGGWTLIAGACARTRSCPLATAIGDERGYGDTSLEGDAGADARVRLTTVAFSGMDAVALAAIDEEAGYAPNAVFWSSDLGRHFRPGLRVDPVASDFVVGSSLGADAAFVPQLTGSIVRAPPGGAGPWTLQPVAHGLPGLPTQFSLSGAHGLATLPGRLFETTDGARTWTEIARVPLGPADYVHCGTEACIVGATLRRIGWSDAPAPSVPIASGFVPDPPPVPWSARPLATCRLSGAAQLTLAGASAFEYPPLRVDPVFDQDGPWRAIVPVQAGAEVTLTAVGVERRGKGTTVASLKLATVQRGAEALSADVSGAGTIVAVFPFKCPSCEVIMYRPQDPIRLAWTTARDPRTVRQATVKIASEEPAGEIAVSVLDGGEALVSFFAGPEGLDGEALVVDGGRVKARYAAPASRLVSVGGKPVAASASWRDERVVLRSLAGRNVRAVWRAPHWIGATWLGPPFGLASDGALPVVWMESADGVFLAPVQKLEPEPSTVVALDPASFAEALVPCGVATRSAARVQVHASSETQVLLEGDGGPVALGVTGEVLRVARDGRACVSVLAAREVHAVQGVPVPVTDVAAVYPDDMEHGVLSRTFVDGRMEMLPLSCKPMKPAATGH
jgi:photosystem II stability/assembly factor-like uncharacterized protein